MQCEEKLRLLHNYGRCLDTLSAIVRQTETAEDYGEYSVRIEAARDECMLAHAKLQKHVSEHGCYRFENSSALR